jgi:hypothetical protein
MQITLLMALLALIFWGGCAPPWYGEEDNYPIVALAFEDTLTHTRIPWANLGITGLENITQQVNLPVGNAFAQPGMNFDSKLNEVEWLLLPIDKADTLQTFVVHHPGGPDTLRFRFQPQYDVEKGEWDEARWQFTVASHTFPVLQNYAYDNPRSSYYHPQIIVWLWVAL